ncbi:MAG: M48 family metalloprotease [Selenomonadaceae bacterium]|nr:M48 family metalloprotease [Selenomonadaceae bacterium]
MKKILIVILLTAATILNPVQVMAADAWAIAAEALGVLTAYQSTLREILSLGNNVNAQMEVRKQDIEKNGVDKNKRDVELVDSIMTRLVDGGQYELRVNSLPFVWNVNDSEKFNASCYPMNYISVNRGLIRGLNLDENQIAAVLAHEMTHGIEQHSAKSYAQAVAQSLGAMMVGMNVDNGRNIDWSKFSAMVDYSIAKNINVPAEYAADEGGFYLMTSAGFNPGGGAAAMNRLGYYVRYETQDVMEFSASDINSDETFSDHPDTDKREEKLIEMMTAYGGGHVTVKKDDRAYKVFIDGAEIFHSINTGSDHNNAAENAYFFAGGLSKAFHDYDSIDAWNFRRVDNRIDLLTDESAYRELRELAFMYNLGEKIQAAVTAAYQNETPATRQKIHDDDKAREKFWAKIKSDADSAKAKAATQLRVNADVYNDYGQGELALKQIERALRAKNQDDIAECLAIRGRAKAICGDYDGALADTNSAVEKDSSNLYNFLNRADVRHMRGELELALADIERALAIDDKNFIAYKLQGDIFDEQGKTAQAEDSYRKCYELSKKNPDLIPINYLEKIDAEAAEKIHKEKAKNES